ncbi:MAG: CTP synthase [Bdellovibrionaceae bacterium]|nr:CTP synthase [Pseudobdellovibrionaceae bacterium]
MSTKTKVKTQTKINKSKKANKHTKYIFVTGGVVSSLGKGLTAASLGSLFRARGFSVSLMKCDPYINVDPGTLSPFQHGEVFVTEDGTEADLDLGHYERFLDCNLGKNHSITTGQVYEKVIANERRGDYLGGTVQVIPHITDEIKRRIYMASESIPKKASSLKTNPPVDISIVEIGGTVGDIEGLPFLEAIRQIGLDLNSNQVAFVHLTYLPYLTKVEELKSKPTQHSVKALREIGIHPNFLICRSEKNVSLDVKKKISAQCSVRLENIISATDSNSIYEVPLALVSNKLDLQLLKHFNIAPKTLKLQKWKTLVANLKAQKKEVTIAVVGKYVHLKESYKSLHEALVHGSVANKVKIKIKYIDSEKITAKNIKTLLKGVGGVLVPGGFGHRAIEGKLVAINYARKNKIPFFGICLGLQMAIIEFAKNVCNLKSATSEEFITKPSDKKHCVIALMEGQKNQENRGASMRLGAYSCQLQTSSLISSIYKSKNISERHRHRYEFNNQYLPTLKQAGLVFSGVNKKMNLIEAIELKNHPWFIGVQFHPEFKSRPLKPHPLFVSFISAILKKESV